MAYRWRKQLKEGHRVENMLMLLFNRVFSGADKLSNEFMGDIGVDNTFIEVKAESYPAENFFIEYEKENGDPSGHMLSDADTYLHWFVDEGVGYLISGPELRTWIELNIREYEEIEVVSMAGDSVWSIIGAAVPIEDVLEKVPFIRFTTGLVYE